MRDNGERLGYQTPDDGDIEVPVYRHNCQEVYAALKQPEAAPYVVAPYDTPIQEIVDFLGPRVKELDELRHKMRKRLEHGITGKCTFQTGDVVYVMGRPFMVDVYPLENRRNMGKGGRRRSTLKCTVDTGLSVIRLYVAQRNYDQARSAFLSYAHGVILKNAANMAAQACSELAPGTKPPAVRMREMRGRFARIDAGALWLSDDIIGYPPDCLMLTVWDAVAARAGVAEEVSREKLKQVVPGWEEAARLLEERAEPYSSQ